MKKLLILILMGILTFTAFSDTYWEDRIEDVLEHKYEYISDGTTSLELDFDVYEGKDIITVIVKVDDDYRRRKQNFKKSVYNNYLKKIEQTVKDEIKGEKKIEIKDYF